MWWLPRRKSLRSVLLLCGTWWAWMLCNAAFFMCRTFSFVAGTRTASPLTKIQCLSIMRHRERLRWLVLQPHLFSISAVTQKGLSLNLSDDVGSEEVFTCFSCLRLCSRVLRFYEAAIANSPQISQIFHVALALLVAFSAAWLSFAELEEFPLHAPIVTSR